MRLLRCHSPAIALETTGFRPGAGSDASKLHSIRCLVAYEHEKEPICDSDYAGCFKMTECWLFSPTLIDQSLKDALPEAYILRPLSRDDFAKGFFENLQTLARTGDVAEERFFEQFDWMKAKGDTYYNVVIEHECKIVANGMLIVERKFIWDLGKVGHIEEVSVSESQQGKGLGKAIIQALNSVARNVGCLKTILDCSTENEGFYGRCGYHRGGVEMEHEFDDFKKWRYSDDL